MHTCNRDNCTPTNITGPKANCIKCKKLCYLLCYGGERSSTGMVRFKLPNSLTIYVDVTNVQFACTECLLEGNVVVQTTMQVAQKTTSKEADVNSVTNDKLMEVLTAGFVELKQHITANVGKSAKDMKDSLDVLTKSMDKTTKLIETPNRTTKSPLYSTILKSKKKVLFKDTQSTDFTPISSKRKRNEDNDNELISTEAKNAKPTVIIPKPRMGISEGVIGQKPKPREPRTPKQMTNEFRKSLRVAGLDPSVTVEQLDDYITKNTPITDSSRFKCTMLVKKGLDLSLLSYISFKIDVSDQDFDCLTNLANWPNYVTVREFIRMDRPKPQSMGDSLQPRKFQRTDNENVTLTPTSSAENLNVENMDLGFQQ